MLGNASTSSACTDFFSNFKIISLLLEPVRRTPNTFFNNLVGVSGIVGYAPRAELKASRQSKSSEPRLSSARQQLFSAL